MDGNSDPEVGETAGITAAGVAHRLAGLPAPGSADWARAEIRALDDPKPALAARRARNAVAFGRAQRREQAPAGVPADQLDAVNTVGGTR